MATSSPVLSRSDYQVVRVFMALAALAAVALLTVPLVQWLTGQPLVILVPLMGSATESGTLPLPGASEGVTAVADQAELTLAQAPAWAWGLGIVKVAIPVLMVLATLYLLWKVVRSVEEGSPFTRANVTRMRAIAGVLTVGVVIHEVASGFINPQLHALAFPDEDLIFLTDDISWGLAAFGAGLLVGVLAEVFARGVTLEAETEGLV